MSSLIIKSEKILQYIADGELNSALESISEWENESNLNIEEDHEINLLKSMLYNRISQYKKSMQYSQDLIIKSKKEQNYYYYFHAIVQCMHSLDSIDYLKQCSELIMEANLIIDGNVNLDKNAKMIRPLGHYYNRLGVFLQKSNKYEEAIQAFQKSLTYFAILNDSLRKADILTNMGNNYALMKSFEKAMKSFNDSLAISRQHGKNINTAWTLAHMSQMSYQMDNDEDILQNLNEALKISFNLNNIHCIDYIYNIMGNYYLKIGEFYEALEYQKLSYKLRKQRGNKLEMAFVLCSIAGIYSRCGEIEKANQYIDKIFLLQEKYSDVLANSLFLSIKGEILAEQCKFQEATKYLEDVLKKFDELQNFNQGYRTIHVLIWIAIIKEDKEKQYLMLEYIQNLMKKYPNHKQIKLFFKLEQGLVFKHSRDTYKEVLAKQIFKELTNQENVKPWIFQESMINHIEILIKEYKYSPNDTIFNEIEKISSQLLTIAKKEIFVALICETLSLKAILAIKQQKLQQGRLLLTKAQKKAEERGLNLLAKKISYEHDNILVLLNSSTENHDKSINSKISNFEFVFSKITRNFKFQISNIHHNPIFLVIWNKTKILLKLNLSSENQDLGLENYDNCLEIYEKSEKLELLQDNTFDRFIIANFMIIVRKFHDIRFHYGYHGNSHFASEKLDGFIKKIQEMKDLWNEISNVKSETISDHVKSKLTECVNDIFYN